MALPVVNPIAIRVPRLGAYALNKAVTFPKRLPREGERVSPKRGKDLLYLRDLMAAGRAVAEVITADVAHMLHADGTVQFVVDAATSALESAERGDHPDGMAAAAAMLAEREAGRSYDGARNDVAGHLTDLLELLLPFRSPAPPAVDDDDEAD